MDGKAMTPVRRPAMMARSFRLFIWLTVLGSAAAQVRSLAAESVDIEAGRDNTLYETTTGNRSNGAGVQINAGRAGSGANGGAIRRGLLWFDVEGNIPAGAQIQSVELTLSLVANFRCR